MLTGDKLKTAENIAISCNLFQPQTMHVFDIDEEKNLENISKKLKEIIETIPMYEQVNKDIGLIIDGESLGTFIEFSFLFLFI